MDKQPVSQSKVEYVDAQPIGEESKPAVSPMPQVHTYYQAKGGCVPCCGPVGCSIMLIGALLLFSDSGLVQPLLIAVGIFVLVSVLSALLGARRL